MFEKYEFYTLKGAEIEDLEHCSQLLVKSMIIREKYMMLSQQSFPYTTAKYLNKVFVDESSQGRRSSIFSNENKEQEFFEKNDGKFKFYFNSKISDKKTISK